MIRRGSFVYPAFAGTGSDTGDPPVTTVSVAAGHTMFGQVIVHVVYFTGGTVNTVAVTDSKGNVYTNKPITIGSGGATSWRVSLWVADLGGAPLSASDTFTVTFTGTGPSVASIQATEYHGLDLSAHTATLTSAQEGVTVFGGPVSAQAGGATNTQSLAYLMFLRAGNGDLDDPTATFTPATTPYFNVADGDTGPLFHTVGHTAGAYRYYTYDLIFDPPSSGQALSGVWSPTSFFAQYEMLGVTFNAATEGVDIVRSTSGAIFVTWQDGLGTVSVARSLDQGDTFDIVRVIGTDAADNAAPALTINPWDEILLAYHTAAGTAKIYSLPDLLESDPVLMGSHVAFKWPRPLLIRAEHLLLAGFNGDLLQVYLSTDLGATKTLSKDYAVQLKERPALRLDRRWVVHIVFRASSGRMLWDWSNDLGLTWDGTTQLAAGGLGAAYAPGPHAGFAGYFSAGVLELKALGSDHHSVDHSAVRPVGTLQPLACGAWVDGDQDSGREDWWLLGKELSALNPLKLFYSKADAEVAGDWSLLAGSGL